MTHALAIEAIKAAAEEHRRSHDGWLDQARLTTIKSYREKALESAKERAAKRDELLASLKVLEEDAAPGKVST